MHRGGYAVNSSAPASLHKRHLPQVFMILIIRSSTTLSRTEPADVGALLSRSRAASKCGSLVPRQVEGPKVGQQWIFCSRLKMLFRSVSCPGACQDCCFSTDNGAPPARDVCVHGSFQSANFHRTEVDSDHFCLFHGMMLPKGDQFE
jgi:hypothetical protein